MTDRVLRTYQKRLREMASRLNREVTTLQQEAQQSTGMEAGGASDEQADPAAQAAEEGTALALLGTEGHTLAEVNAALDRIDRGTFGRCEACGHAITGARLEALPYARHCIACARRTDALNPAFDPQPADL